LFAAVSSGLLSAAPVKPENAESAQANAGEVANDLAARTVTLEGDVLVAKALAELTKQTGIQVEDRRRVEKQVKVKLDLRQTPFWRALDTIAREADARVSLYHREGKVTLVDGPHLALPTSYSGPFRVVLKRLNAVRDLETDAHFCVANLEVAWEPTLKPFLVETLSDSLVITDDKDRKLEVLDLGKGEIPVAGPLAMTIELRLPAPQRSAAAIGLLKGTFAVIAPSKMLTFTFDKLKPIARPGDHRKETQEGVTVILRELTVVKDEEQLWTVGFLLEYPEDGRKFESFQSWLLDNQLYLEKGPGKQRFPANGGYETGGQTATRAAIRYRFIEEPEKKLLLGSPGEWRLVYRTPGRIVEVPVPFEFKNLPLP
jgi:hypothetical protein